MDKAVLTEIVREVIKELQNRKRLLVILEGHAEELYLLEDIRNYAGESSVTILSLSDMIKEKALERYGYVMTGDSLSEHENWINEYDEILLPAPSLTTISRIAHIIIEGIVPQIVYSGIEKGKKILVGPLSQNKKLCNLPSGLRKETLQLYKKLRDFGIEEIELSIPQTINNIVDSKKILSLRDIELAEKEGSNLAIDENTIITPLASDYIRDKGLTLMKKG